jgi:hypothetical protein
MTPPLAARARPGLAVALGATLLAFGVWAALETVAATDLYWAMATGRWIVTHREIPPSDVFSFTYAGAPWSNQEWLSQILFYELFAHGGGDAVAVFRILATVALLFLAAWLGVRRGASPVAAVAMACAAAAVCRPNLDIRPHLFQFLGTLGVIGLVDAYRRRAGWWALVLLPLVLAVWVNAHFSFILGLGIVWLLAAAEALRTALRLPGALPPTRARALAAAAALAAIACLANPQGPRALVFPFTLLGADELWRREIIEWRPPPLFRTGEPFTTAVLGWYLVAQALLAALVLATQPRRFDPSNALVVLTTAVMALGARRFGPLFALVAAPFGAVNLTLLAQARGLGVRTVASGAAVVAACAAAVGYLAVDTVAYVRERYRPGLYEGMSQQWIFPRDAVAFLNRNPLPARLAHLYQWGGYLMFHAPARPVFIDGRGHTVYPGPFYLEYKELEYGTPGWRAVLDRHRVSLVLWPSGGLAMGQFASLLQQLRRAPDWRRIYDDGQAAVFAHTERGRAWAEAFAAFTLAYPDTYGAQLFLADAYFAAHRFERARETTRAALRRFGTVPAGPTPGEQQVLAAAERDGSPLAWFHVGMYRDVRDDAPGAAAAYRTALARGLGEPHAAYAREALARLGPGS